MSVELVGSDGARLTAATNTVTLSVSGAETLRGTTSTNAVSGIATFSGIALTKAGSGYQITATSGTLTAISNAFAISAGAVSPTNSIFTPSSFTANVATTLTFTFRDAYGNPTPSATVSLSTTAAGSTFTPASGTTGTDGTFVTSFRTTSGGTLPIAATVGGVGVTFSASVNSAVGTVNYFVRDASGALVPSITVVLTYAGGSFQSSSPGSGTFTNVPAGAIRVEASKTGYNSNSASGTLTAGGALTLNVVMAVASSLCAAVPLTFPGTVNGTLNASSCQQSSQPTAVYSFNVGSNPGVRFTLTPSGFTPTLAVTQNPPTQWINWTNGTNPVQVLWLLPTGSYQVRAAATTGTGTYSLTGASDAGLLTTSTVGGVSANATGSCPVAATLLVSMTVSGQSLTSTDCLRADASSYDTYYLASSSPCTITMRSTAFDAYLSVYDATTGALIRSDDDSGGGNDARVALTACSSGGNVLEVWANSFLARQTGAYTLTLSLGAGAATTLAGSGQMGGVLVNRAPARLTDQVINAKGVKAPK